MNLIPPLIRNKAIQFFVSKTGSAALPFLSVGVGIAVAKLCHYFPGVEALIDQKAVVAVIWGIIMAGANYATNHWLTKDAKVIQESLVKLGAKLDLDGWVGDDTVKAFEMKTGIEVRKTVAVEPKDNSGS